MYVVITKRQTYMMHNERRRHDHTRLSSKPKATIETHFLSVLRYLEDAHERTDSHSRISRNAMMTQLAQRQMFAAGKRSNGDTDCRKRRTANLLNEPTVTNTRIDTTQMTIGCIDASQARKQRHRTRCDIRNVPVGPQMLRCVTHQQNHGSDHPVKRPG